MQAKRISMALIKVAHRAYRLLLSPFIGQQCRFHPRCSDYAVEAFDRHGIILGCTLSAYRILRCNPYSKSWGEDPVPREIRFLRRG